MSETNLSSAQPTYTLRQLVLYFLKLGYSGFGGPVALVGYMHRDLVERVHIEIFLGSEPRHVRTIEAHRQKERSVVRLRSTSLLRHVKRSHP